MKYEIDIDVDCIPDGYKPIRFGVVGVNGKFIGEKNVIKTNVYGDYVYGLIIEKVEPKTMKFVEVVGAKVVKPGQYRYHESIGSFQLWDGTNDLILTRGEKGPASVWELREDGK